MEIIKTVRQKESVYTNESLTAADIRDSQSKCMQTNYILSVRKTATEKKQSIWKRFYLWLTNLM